MLKYHVIEGDFGAKLLEVSFQGKPPVALKLDDFYFKDNGNINSMQAHNALYAQINEYVATLPIQSQEALFDIFSKVVNSDYQDTLSGPEYTVKLENKISQASKLLGYENFKMYIRSIEHLLLIPDTVQLDYVLDQDMNTTQEKTYIRSEYRDLIGLILFIRAMSPIYVGYYHYIKTKTAHYYYKLFMLFIASDVYTSPEAEKLKCYIEVNQITLMGTNKNDHLVLSGGLSDDDTVDSLVSEIVFNKLLPIDFVNKQCNIVSFIFQTIKFKGNFSTAEGGAIRAKTFNGSKPGEDPSYFESYRKTTDIPIGTKTEIQHSLDDINRLIADLGFSDFDYAGYENDLKHITEFAISGIDEHQKHILGWFLGKVIDPRSLFYIEQVKVIELMFMAKRILISQGHDFIARFLFSRKVKYSSSENQSSPVNVMFNKSINKDLVKRLAPYYGFAMDPDKQSLIERTIVEISKGITSNIWKVVGDDEFMVKGRGTGGTLVIPNDLYDVMCLYVEFVNNPNIRGDGVVVNHF